MYFYNYGPLNPSLMPNKEKFGDMGCFVSHKLISFYIFLTFFPLF